MQNNKVAMLHLKKQYESNLLHYSVLEASQY